ncbi:50S ribosomal protein L22 [bacterium]|jgi:large subunit ribosomal protein L22|nr:50S ribosomal protein L22 [bacterium]MBT6832424.1 50S ribosomal protein L22 [bacterium]MBT6996008.1 50S ribosomal protein L22 [bacterium]MBT7772570.1 50S ribosomal protein L22 [bacterium]
MKAHLRKIQISSKKVNVVAGLVRGKTVTEALNILKFTPKTAAKSLYKVVQSAVANAEQNFDKKRAQLAIEQIIVNRGEFWKRFLPSTRGRALQIMKPTCHISVMLKEIEGKLTGKKSVATPEKKETTKPAAKPAAKKAAPKKPETPAKKAPKAQK